MFFDGFTGLLRVVVVGTASYVALLVLLKISGKRTLAKLNAFDFVVTIALGSTLSTVLLSKDVALAEGVVAMGLLVALQFGVAWLVSRSSRVERLVKSEPALLYRNEFLVDAMRRARVSESELRQAARSQGYADLDDVQGLVLESDGTISVLTDVPRFARPADD
ncbi:MAG: DUF421 domain-containing protein [Propionibacteriaceae bacterium]